MQPFVFRADDAARLRAPLVLETMKTENPLPEDRKRMIEKWYDVLSQPGYDCIFDDELPPESEHRCKLTPLETVPLLTVNAEAGITQKDVDKAARLRAATQAENTDRTELRLKLLKVLKAHVGAAILRAIETNAPQLHRRMKS